MELLARLVISGSAGSSLRDYFIVGGSHDGRQLGNSLLPWGRLQVLDVLTELTEDTQVPPLLGEDLVASANVRIVELIDRRPRAEGDLLRGRDTSHIGLTSHCEAGIMTHLRL